MSDYDFIILGAGSAGCVLAIRLSESVRFTATMPGQFSVAINKLSRTFGPANLINHAEALLAL